jgi:hypothetical protein
MTRNRDAALSSPALRPAGFRGAASGEGEESGAGEALALGLVALAGLPEEEEEFAAIAHQLKKRLARGLWPGCR